MPKNHQMVNGKLLQTNKQWSALKQRQKEWITETARQAHSKAVQENGKPVNKTGKLEIIEAVYAQIEAREIWIPYGEVVKHIAPLIDRWNRRYLAATNTEHPDSQETTTE